MKKKTLRSIIKLAALLFMLMCFILFQAAVNGSMPVAAALIFMALSGYLSYACFSISVTKSKRPVQYKKQHISHAQQARR